jgi:hypothetical protein
VKAIHTHQALYVDVVSQNQHRRSVQTNRGKYLRLRVRRCWICVCMMRYIFGVDSACPFCIATGHCCHSLDGTFGVRCKYGHGAYVFLRVVDSPDNFSGDSVM